jgi:hypothetical protein
MSPEIAERTYDELLDPKDGFFRNARVSTEGVPAMQTSPSTKRLNVDSPFLLNYCEVI